MSHHSFTTSKADSDVDAILAGLPPCRKSSWIVEAIRLNSPTILKREIIQAREAEGKAIEALARIEKILADRPAAEATVEQIVARLWPHWLTGQQRYRKADSDNLVWISAHTTRPNPVLAALKARGEAERNPVLDNFHQAKPEKKKKGRGPAVNKRGGSA